MLSRWMELKRCRLQIMEFLLMKATIPRLFGKDGSKEKMIDSNETVMYENGRDSGYLEGYENGLSNKVEILKPHPTEAITLFYDMENMTYEQVFDNVEYLKNKFPNNKVIAIPDKTSLESCSKDVLENYISMIAEIIEEL